MSSFSCFLHVLPLVLIYVYIILTLSVNIVDFNTPPAHCAIFLFRPTSRWKIGIYSLFTFCTVYWTCLGLVLALKSRALGGWERKEGNIGRKPVIHQPSFLLTPWHIDSHWMCQSKEQKKNLETERQGNFLLSIWRSRLHAEQLLLVVAEHDTVNQQVADKKIKHPRRSCGRKRENETTDWYRGNFRNWNLRATFFTWRKLNYLL